MLLLSSGRAMVCANHSLQSFFVQEEFFSESIVFQLNMDSKTLFNVFLSVFCSCSHLSLEQLLHLFRALQILLVLHISTNASNVLLHDNNEQCCIKHILEIQRPAYSKSF